MFYVCVRILTVGFSSALLLSYGIFVLSARVLVCGRKRKNDQVVQYATLYCPNVR